MRLETSTILNKMYIFGLTKANGCNTNYISGLILCEKAIQVSKKLFGEGYKFVASEGWKWTEVL